MHNEAIESGNQDENPRAKHVFKPSSWLTKIDFINHLVLFNNKMLTVLAEQGGGKTTFISLLQAGLDTSIKSHVVTATAPFSQADFLIQLAAIFHLRDDAEPTIANILHQINERKAHVLVIIDEAHHIPDILLQDILIALQQQKENNFFHFCLVSDFSIIASLNKLKADSFEALIHTLEPGVLTESEMKTYLLHALPAPKRLDKTMTDKRLGQFYQLTGGNIARINSQMVSYFCPRSLKAGVQQKSFAKRLNIATSMVVVVLASVYLWQHQHLVSPDKLLPPEQDLPEPVTVISEEPLSSVVPAVPQIQQEPELVSEMPVIRQQELVSKIPAWYIAAEVQPVQPPPLKRITNIVLDDDEGNDDSLVVMDRVVVIPKTLQKQSLTGIERGNPATRENISDTELKQRIAQSVTENGKVIKDKAVKEQYTIQLQSSQNQDDLKRFIRSHHIELHAAIRLTKRQGMDWYVLTLGEYDQFAQAKVVVNNLPAELVRFKPWIRSLSGLKALG
ncbi:AAA family ATPase [Legionella tunisiensis]|uniref:AAA family ATPase n=1 Tax=Legionella tunisiensis TaxID=1034944 RepID=UPI0002E26C5F|nr:AAA family ATPase [Legionella tunisiensis]